MTYLRACRLPARLGRPALVPGGLACAAARRFSLSPAPICLPSLFGAPLTTAVQAAPSLPVEPPPAPAS